VLRGGLVATVDDMSLNEIGPKVFGLHADGKYQEALDVVAAAYGSIEPDDRPSAWYWMICLTSRIGDLERAETMLETALGRGWWFGDEMLRADADVAPMQGRERWEALVLQSLRLAAQDAVVPADAERAAATSPSVGAVVALHARWGRAPHTRDTWLPATALGYDVVAPTSSQRTSHDRGVWDDLDRAALDVTTQSGSLAGRIVVTGRSQGAGVALRLATEGAIRAAAAILVAPALPTWGPTPGDVTIPVYFVLGEEDDARFVDPAAEFAATASVPVHIETIAGMGHLYPHGFGDVIGRALAWCEEQAP